jgi:hypothetical protein
MLEQIVRDFVRDSGTPSRGWMCIVIEDYETIAALNECARKGRVRRVIEVVARRTVQTPQFDNGDAIVVGKLVRIEWVLTGDVELSPNLESKSSCICLEPMLHD